MDGDDVGALWGARGRKNMEQAQAAHPYYADKLPTLRRVFGTPAVQLEADALRVQDARYPILHDVIVLLPPEQYSPHVRRELSAVESRPAGGTPRAEFAADVQFSFGEEWQEYGAILEGHKQEFGLYFDIVDLERLRGRTLCDLGCGMGRWSYFLRELAGALLLVDFSDAIFVARRNLGEARNALFFQCDIGSLPFADECADFVFSLGVLHHLPTDCLDEVRRLRRLAPELLIYLYYALDNRPLHYRLLLHAVTLARRAVCRVRSRAFRRALSKAGTYLVYLPLIGLGRALRPVGLDRYVPLYDGYRGRTSRRIEQDVYDRFFTPIEQRVTRRQIAALSDTFSRVIVADTLPYWHFLCQR